MSQVPYTYCRTKLRGAPSCHGSSSPSLFAPVKCTAKSTPRRVSTRCPGDQPRVRLQLRSSAEDRNTGDAFESGPVDPQALDKPECSCAVGTPATGRRAALV